MEKINVDKDQIKEVIKFLDEYHFVIIDHVENKVKLEEAVQKFLTQTTI